MDKNKDSKTSVSLDTLDFLKRNVFNITDITRKNKLTEILDKFATEITEEVFVIQNAKNKDAKGVLVDLEFFQELLSYKEMLDQAYDKIIMEEAALRKDQKATLSLTDVFDDEDIDFDLLRKEIGD